MKLIRTKGRGAQQTAELLAALEDRGGAALDAVLPAVRRIVADVRKKGDRALLRYAAQFDGLQGVADLRITPDEMAAAWKSIDSDFYGKTVTGDRLPGPFPDLFNGPASRPIDPR